MKKITYSIIGGGWRAEFYLRIAKYAPEVFDVSAVCVRNHERAKVISREFNVKVFSTIEETLSEPCDFVVNCISKNDISNLSVQLADQGYYVLSETPVTSEPTPSHNYAKIQIAEQFHLKGTYQAIKKIIDAGVIGEVNHINISVAHDYHAMSIIRFLLDDYSRPEMLGCYSFDDKMLRTNGRVGELEIKSIEDTTQIMKIFKFKNATVIYDYNKEQYFSPIRKDRILVRGATGEIENSHVRYMNEKNEYVDSEIKLITSGLFDGFYNDKILFEDKTVFSFPFKKERFSEEETAIAECLIKMSEYINCGTELYSYKKAYEDYEFFNSFKNI